MKLSKIYRKLFESHTEPANIPIEIKNGDETYAIFYGYQNGTWSIRDEHGSDMEQTPEVEAASKSVWKKIFPTIPLGMGLHNFINKAMKNYNSKIMATENEAECLLRCAEGYSFSASRDPEGNLGGTPEQEYNNISSKDHWADMKNASNLAKRIKLAIAHAFIVSKN